MITSIFFLQHASAWDGTAVWINQGCAMKENLVSETFTSFIAGLLGYAVKEAGITRR